MKERSYIYTSITAKRVREKQKIRKASGQFSKEPENGEVGETERVITVRIRLMQQVIVGYSTVAGYVSAVVHLWVTQREKG